jgi:hypothetical protein
VTAERLAYIFRADSYAVWLSLVGLAVAARIAMEIAWRHIDRATTLGGQR